MGIVSKAQGVLMALWLVAFLTFGFMSISHTVLNMGSDGMALSNCLFMSNQATVCDMSPLEHIAAWQSMVTIAPLQNDLGLLMALLIALTLALVWTTHYLQESEQRPRVRFSDYVRRENYPPPSLYQDLFSDGILNPKLF